MTDKIKEIIKEVASKKGKWSGADRATYNRYASKMNAVRDTDPSGVDLRMMHYDLHKGNPTTKSGKPLKPSVRNSLRVLATSHVQSQKKTEHERAVERIRADLPNLTRQMELNKKKNDTQSVTPEKKGAVSRIMSKVKGAFGKNG